MIDVRDIRATAPGGLSALDIAAGGGIVTAVAFAFLAPDEAVQGDLSRLMYVHVPTVWLAYVAFIVTFAASAMYLITRRPTWDRTAAASAEVGVYFTGITILMGMVWGKPTWGVWWTWEARLVLTAIMFFAYLGYLALRRSVVDPTIRAKRSAVFGIVAVVQIPLVHFSVIWWRSLHQQATVLRADLDPQLDPPILAALLVGTVAFTVVYAALLVRGRRLAALEVELHELQIQSNEVAGDAVSKPGAAVSTPVGSAPALRWSTAGWVVLGLFSIVLPFIVVPPQESQWSWVGLGFFATYATLAAYVALLVIRTSTVTRHIERMR